MTTWRNVMPGVWLFKDSCNVYAVEGPEGCLMIDYGYDWKGAAFPIYPYPANRRVLLHDLECLKKQFGIERIDVVLVSHFHDDHVCGIPLLQRLFDTPCWTGMNNIETSRH